MGNEKTGESMKDYERELEASFRTINEGDVIKGLVIDVTDEEVTLDLKYYTQGIVRVSDLSDDPNFSILDDVKIGDEMEATVISTDDGQGNILLSKKLANSVLAWDVLKEYKNSKKELPVKISETVKAGAICYVEGIRGFIPASQLDLSFVEDTSVFLHKKLMVRITEVDQNKEKLILSAKEILMEKQADEREHKIAMLVPGTIFDGTVENLQQFGAFVNIGDGLSGLVHISQICDRRIRKPSEVLKVGDKVKVKLLNTNEGKISLSIKAVGDIFGEEDTAEEADKELMEYSANEEIGTSLGDLLKNFKFN